MIGVKLSTKLKLIALAYNNIRKKHPLVLNIELSHLCNLECIHCGRIRDDVKGRLTVDEVCEAIDVVDPPIVYFTGGEPFLFPRDLAKGVNYALAKKKVVFIVTNGTLLSKVLDTFDVHPHDHLVLMFSVDGMKQMNDRIRGEGVFDGLREGIQKAAAAGFRHRWMNFTVYRSNMHDVEEVMASFQEMIELFHFNLYFDFLGNAPGVGDEVSLVSDKLQSLKERYNICNPYLYFETWKGLQLDCTPWGTVTRDASGWKSPCYFIDGPHYQSYAELMASVDWNTYVKKQAKECANCRAHCGFEPTIYGDKRLLAKELGLRIKHAWSA